MAQAEYRRQYELDTVPVRLVEVYDPLIPLDGDDTPELIDIVVGSRAMSRDDWVRARIFADFAELLFFDRFLHVVLLALGEGRGWDYRRMIEAFVDADAVDFPLVAKTREIFETRARSILQGEPQFIPSQEWLGVWWPADQYALIGLARGGWISDFYAEARQILERLPGGQQECQLIEDAVRLNEAMFSVPFVWNDLPLELSYPVATFYLSLGNGAAGSLERHSETCVVRRSQAIWLSWDDWCEDLVRRHYVRRGYLWDVQTVEVPCPRALCPAAAQAWQEECSR
jgi:hypothetical protein